ncbi:MAG: peptidase T [Oscillochloridaceae bacterium umkhey_bin13]
MTTPFDRELEERLVRYVQIDTTADPTSTTSPSSAHQYDLLNLLANELKALGVQDVTVTGYGTVLGTVPATPGVTAPTVAFLAHVDTAPAFSGTGIKPMVHHNYAGGPIHFPDDPDLVLDPAVYPYLAQKVGDDIITASGITLLGADDKAGVAIIMAMVNHLRANPELVHGPIRVCFTPDEEIGRGVHRDLPKDLAADVAYTLDGAHLGEIVYETFSADGATIQIEGVSIHPGWAKGKLVNALHLGAKIIDLLPKATRTPETTEGREGFILVHDFHGNAAAATIQLALRDFERDGLASHGALLQQICAVVQATEPRATITCTLTPQYRNMRYWLEDNMRPVELAREACRQIGVEPFSIPTRGGTDGSRLTEMGVPTPNLFTGMQEIHGPLEWISVQDMGRATQMCVKLAELWAKG